MWSKVCKQATYSSELRPGYYRYMLYTYIQTSDYKTIYAASPPLNCLPFAAPSHGRRSYKGNGKATGPYSRTALRENGNSRRNNNNCSRDKVPSWQKRNHTEDKLASTVHKETFDKSYERYIFCIDAFMWKNRCGFYVASVISDYKRERYNRPGIISTKWHRNHRMRRAEQTSNHTNNEVVQEGAQWNPGTIYPCKK